MQYYLAARDNINYDSWLSDVGPEGFHNTYIRLFGDPFAQEVQPLIPADLVQPTLKLPWTSGETWFFSGGPHGGWNTRFRLGCSRLCSRLTQLRAVHLPRVG